MRRWARWQDWVAVAAGLYAALSPIWTVTGPVAVRVLLVLGIATIVAALINLGMPNLLAMEWVEVLLGALLFISPWVLMFSAAMGAAWTAWITGGVTIVVGVWDALTKTARMPMVGARPEHETGKPSHA